MDDGRFLNAVAEKDEVYTPAEPRRPCRGMTGLREIHHLMRHREPDEAETDGDDSGGDGDSSGGCGYDGDTTKNNKKTRE
ncbi:hypothetical protein E2C01_044561 [Portunus trituberculatus]|uniref:Uncharacterized protein n=1 Tax=Portunus trituberculatus TaxID=210409 RepID=A0A5B7FTF8_PORTR|nr:hypothetical protein [Portunus trituberculatus]